MRLSRLMTGLLLLPTLAQAQDVRISTQLLPDTGIRAGQTLHYQIDVMTDTWLTGTPEFSALEIPDTLVSFEGSHGRPIQRTLDGKRYFGISYRYRLVPLQAGVLSIPAQSIQVPIGQAKQPVNTTTPGIRLAVGALPALESGQLSLLAGDVQLSQKLDPASAAIEQGQVVTREIRVEAHNALPLSIPPVSHSSDSPLEGTRLPATISALSDAGGNPIGGVRIESIRYLPEQTGTKTLPPLELSWWDIDENKVKHARLPAMMIEVVPPAVTTVLPTGLQHWSSRLISQNGPAVWLILLTGVLLWAGFYYRRWLFGLLTPAMEAWKRHWRESRVRARLHARKQLRQQPSELTATYQLLQLESGGRNVRHSDLDKETKQNMLDGLDHLYSPVPNRAQARQRLTSALKHLGRNRQNSIAEANYKGLPALNAKRSDRDTTHSRSTEEF